MRVEHLAGPTSKGAPVAQAAPGLLLPTRPAKKVSINLLMLLLFNLALPFLFLLLLQAPGSASAFFIDQHHSPASHEWSYSRQQDWRQEHKQCGHRAQSPIDIQRRHVIPNNQLKLYFYNYNQATKFKIQNAHHTIKLNPIENFGQQDSRFGFKLRSGNDGDFNSSLPDLLTADEEPEVDYEQMSGKATVNHHHQSVAGSSSQGQHPKQGQQQPPQQQHQANNRNGRIGSSSSPTGQDSNIIDQLEPDLSSLPGANEVPPYNGAPTIKLDWLDDGNNEYKLRDIHFHWGERRDNGSEHAIDGRRAAMEMHLVHIKHGLEKSKIGFTSDSVTVIAVLIESYRKSNADFNPIVNSLTRINMTEQPQEIEYKSINDLLPNVLTSFYTYSGSLTTPPCYQVVNWIIMSDRLYLNAKQIEMFRNLYAPAPAPSSSNLPPPTQPTASAPHDGRNQHGDMTSKLDTDSEHFGAYFEPKLIMPNIRLIQPLNNRTILASFSPLSRLEQIQVANSPYNAATSSSLSGLSGVSTIISLVLICWLAAAHKTITLLAHKQY